MADDDDRKLRWTREKDEKAKLWGTIFAAFVASLGSLVWSYNTDNLSHEDYDIALAKRFESELVKERERTYLVIRDAVGETSEAIRFAVNRAQDLVKDSLHERKVDCMELGRELGEKILEVAADTRMVGASAAANNIKLTVFRKDLVELQKHVHGDESSLEHNGRR